MAGNTSNRGSRRAPKRTGKRIRPGLVAASSAAILSIYAAGYARTNSAAQAAVAPVTAAAQPTAAAPAAATASLPATGSAATDVPPTSTPVPPASVAAAAPSLPSSAATAVPTTTASATAGLRDGTYSGVGSSRHGDIGVSVVVQGGRVVSAEITQCMTRYPCSVIASLPGQVVAMQRPPVNYVSGATDSSQAFTGAVVAALAQAH